MNWKRLRPRFGSNMTKDQIDQAPGHSTYSEDPNLVGFVLIGLGVVVAWGLILVGLALIIYRL